MITSTVTAGYSAPIALTQDRPPSSTSANPHHSAQPACMDGIAAYWLVSVPALCPEYSPHEPSACTGSTKPSPVRKRGGASG
ncbi:hypothetical protein Tcur_3104 [Thermomonospora curvata DSM 43183]|uniref:Uncharacterized protein n=1 Tax=Thermomonospora curvata (strain ATCC 19995 / DSM 43183 / JCM 3096 / KCTC 9072 / NBRC 15933 / NCIMB 10081 / Henssen B9) TaxID=471852 RepID=D1A908_THECD|nr:hypothetical protein Tcur_3104 [Thermomonospora curvata DSM 43183]